MVWRAAVLGEARMVCFEGRGGGRAAAFFASSEVRLVRRLGGAGRAVPLPLASGTSGLGL